jgi:hypothetical protein
VSKLSGFQLFIPAGGLSQLPLTQLTAIMISHNGQIFPPILLCFTALRSSNEERCSHLTKSVNGDWRPVKVASVMPPFFV